MTCLNTIQLLEDYADNELSPEKTIEIKKHLDECLSCQNEYSIIRNLKELVQQKPVYNPGEEYWSETSNIILARTVELSDSKYA
ncbi:MAG: anti-sigma factor family protein, partial [Candidatus Zixiibacteriota bacterium]